MKNKKDISMIALMFFVTRSFFNSYNFNNFYSFIIMYLFILIVIYFIKKIKTNLLNHNFFRYIFILISILTFALTIIHAGNFINTNYFRYNNFIIITLTLLITSYFLSKNNIKTIASISEIYLAIFILVSIIIYINLLPNINVNNYFNYFRFKFQFINYTPLLLIVVLFYLKENNITIGYTLGSISILIDNIILVGSLGKLIFSYKYPGVSILQLLNLFNFINHVDKFFSFIYLFEYTITLSLLFFMIKSLLTKKD